MLKKLFLIFPIIPKLGIYNVAYMVWYRIGLNLGIRKKKFILGKSIQGDFFKSTNTIANYPESWKIKTLKKANSIKEGNLSWFHYHTFKVGNPPNWFQNPFDDSILNNPKKHWTDLSDFDLNTGDIKIIWELSRFDWLTDLARAYKVDGNEKFLQTINKWLENWSFENPKNQGPNWKCGQEVAIRVMKLITASQLLAQDKTSSHALQQFVYEHVERIAGNINYAMVQDNNHGTSEAAGLYIGTLWLAKQQQPLYKNAKLENWKNKGRKLLENRILKLITTNGTFSQRSITYHRVVVDTLSWVLINMRSYDELPFNSEIKNRIEALGEFQLQMIANKEGEVPNLGSNDGAMFLNLHNADYRDFRPSTQLFFAALRSERKFEKGIHDEPIWWYFPDVYKRKINYKNDKNRLVCIDDELILLKHNELKVFMKLPNDRYRFATCDPLHIDIWWKGENILGDSGSYSYNAGEVTKKIKSISSHNTVQFGESEPMPSISRFLYGKWLDVENVKITSAHNANWVAEASYTDYLGNQHLRALIWKPDLNQLIIEDHLHSSCDEEKKLYWHFLSSQKGITLNVQDEHGVDLSFKTNKAYHSLYYMEKELHECKVFSTSTSKFKTTLQF